MASLVDPCIPAGRLGRDPQPVLPVGDGLRLRPWRLADAPAVVEAFEDPALQRWHLRRADSVPEAEGWIKGWQDGWPAETSARWALASADDDEVLGQTSLRMIDLLMGEAECSYWVTRPARGRGAAPAALAALSRWALEEAGFHRLFLVHSVHNALSCRVAAKTGFGFEGTRRSALRHADGWHDMHLHARVAGDA
ncbi:MAG TPA: GNAT family N-acetyltransferase [Streptomyces sp.]|jgi:RimJ/RimL family protein N-acetyltransferase|nr:GNAT family N-acetyltransferase [Streptomyces sp.]